MVNGKKDREKGRVSVSMSFSPSERIRNQKLTRNISSCCDLLKWSFWANVPEIVNFYLDVCIHIWITISKIVKHIYLMCWNPNKCTEHAQKMTHNSTIYQQRTQTAWLRDARNRSYCSFTILTHFSLSVLHPALSPFFENLSVLSQCFSH